MSPIPTSDSTRLSALRFPLIVAVVFIHANNDRVGQRVAETAPLLERVLGGVRSALSDGVAATAVPLFFLVSGYLFFGGLRGAAGLRAAYGSKLRSRVRTLLVPYLFWNVALALALAVARAAPATRGLLSGAQGAFLDAGPLGWINAVLGITVTPVAYQFWFIRDLMLAVLLAPLMYAFVVRAPLVGLVLLAAPWLTHTWPIKIPGAVALLFFYVGGLARMRGASLFALDRGFVAVACAYGAVLGCEVMGWTGEWFPYVHQVGIVLGMVTVLGATRLAVTRPSVGAALTTLASSAFFVFAAHEPLLTIARRVAAKATHAAHPALDFALYLALPTVIVIALVVIDRVLRRVAPRFTALITGGR
ncbi:MAG: acyltransferase [Planctomycetota bacterium]